MRAAYLNQVINLVVSILMVPTLLHYLDVSSYLLWVIFTTFGGVTLQVESSIQVMSVRRIARCYHAGDSGGLNFAIRQARNAYTVLAVISALPVFIAGVAYLASYGASQFATGWMTPWMLYMAAYSVNYYFGANSCILLAHDRVSTFSYINALTRSSNYLSTLFLLSMGLSVLGICLSFAVSVLLGCLLISVAARSAMRNDLLRPPDPDLQGDPSQQGRAIELVKYASYGFAAYFVYKGGVLLAASSYPKSLVAPYSLTIQAMGMLSTVALVPVQVWLARLVKAIVSQNHAVIKHEMLKTTLLANSVFIAGAIFLAFMGNQLLYLIHTKVMFPSAQQVLTVAAAFMLELNLLVWINLLVTKRRLTFVWVYVACAMVSLAVEFLAVSASMPLLLALIVLPLAVQSMVCAPMVLRLVRRELTSAGPAINTFASGDASSR